MKFIELGKNLQGVMIFARIDDDGLCRFTCLEEHPDYQAWLNPTEHLTESVTKAK